MTPAPDLQQLIDTVRHDAGSDDELAQLRQAALFVGDLEDVGDSLLGHYVDRCRRAGRSWSEISGVLGVTRQAAHKRYAGFQVTFERFTPRAKAVVNASRELARAADESVGTAHLLLALFEPWGSIAAQVLRDCGLDRSMAAATLGLPLDMPLPTRRGDDEPPFAPDASEALRAALREALQLRHNYIGTEHILLGLFADPDNRAAGALRALGVAVDDVRARVIAMLAELTAAKPPGDGA
jgi:hypothetical protein